LHSNYFQNDDDPVTRDHHLPLFTLSGRLSSSTVTTTTVTGGGGTGDHSMEHLSTATSASGGFLSSVTTLTTDGVTSPTSIAVLPLSSTCSSFPPTGGGDSQELALLQDGACFTHVTLCRRNRPDCASPEPLETLLLINDRHRNHAHNISLAVEKKQGVDDEIISQPTCYQKSRVKTGSCRRSNRPHDFRSSNETASPWKNFRARKFQFGLSSSVRSVKTKLSVASKSQKEKSATRRERKATKTLAIVLGRYATIIIFILNE